MIGTPDFRMQADLPISVWYGMEGCDAPKLGAILQLRLWSYPDIHDNVKSTFEYLDADFSDPEGLQTIGSDLGCMKT